MALTGCRCPTRYVAVAALSPTVTAWVAPHRAPNWTQAGAVGARFAGRCMKAPVDDHAVPLRPDDAAVRPFFPGGEMREAMAAYGRSGAYRPSPTSSWCCSIWASDSWFDAAPAAVKIVHELDYRMLSATDDAETMIAALNEGAAGFLPKTTWARRRERAAGGAGRGIYLPARSVINAVAPAPVASVPSVSHGRNAEIIDRSARRRVRSTCCPGWRRGRSNKIICPRARSGRVHHQDLCWRWFRARRGLAHRAGGHRSAAADTFVYWRRTGTGPTTRTIAVNRFLLRWAPACCWSVDRAPLSPRRACYASRGRPTVARRTAGRAVQPPGEYLSTMANAARPSRGADSRPRYSSRPRCWPAAVGPKPAFRPARW